MTGYLSHPSIPRQCRYDDDCPSPPLSRVSLGYDQAGRAVLVAVRPVLSSSAVGVPVCTDHLHYVVDDALISSLPDRDPAHEQQAGVPRLVEASEADLLDDLPDDLPADALVEDLLGPVDPDAQPGGPDGPVW